MRSSTLISAGAVILLSTTVLVACGSGEEAADVAASAAAPDAAAWITSDCATLTELADDTSVLATSQFVNDGVGVDVSNPAAPLISVLPNPAGASELAMTTIKDGSGAEAVLGSTITVQYCGVGLSTGIAFDSSWARGAPASFPLVEGGLIDGWVQGVPGMKVGEQRMLVIPGSLAYGESSPGGTIEPNETLVFLVELVSVDS
jgi:peptidylprolyl isomerase